MACRLPFDGSTGIFHATTTLVGPLSNLVAGNQQGGVMFGPSQDNYVKLVAINQAGIPSIQFFKEEAGVGVTVGTPIAIPTPANVSSLELVLIADQAARTVRAAYRVNGGTYIAMPGTVTLSSAQAALFFSTQAKAGVLTTNKGADSVEVVFERFAIGAGDPTAAPVARDALYRLDVAGAAPYTDTAGQVWTRDVGLFSPPTAIDEGAAVTPLEIANTADDVIYRTYRGNVGSVPIAQRVLTYNLGTRGLTSVDLRLHFAERAAGNNLPGERVFDIEAEGEVLRNDFDIVTAAGGQNTAIVVPFEDVQVADGNLTLVFRTEVDYASIAGIEVLCPATCPPPDLTAPSAPTGLDATGSSTGNALDWADNTEPDLAGYNVYRSASATGTFTKVNGSLVVGSAYNDVDAPAGVASFYRVTAVDSATNESPVSNTDDATRTTAAVAIRINTGGPAQTVGPVTWSGCTSLTACNGYVTGGFLYAQNPAPAITNPVSPANQAVYQTEWTGGQTNGVPVGGVAFTFGVPVPNGNYQVRLHFAELNKTGAGQRVFDVNIEGGANELTGFDVWTQAAGINRAIVREFTTTVVDGNLTIQFIRQVENAKISGIEILSLETTPPLAPTGLDATGSSTGNALDWADNTEPDLAGYNVYRSASATGTFTKVNGSLVVGSAYNDVDAPAGVASFYRVTAVDSATNESPVSNTDDATRTTAAVAIRINTGGPAQTVGPVTWSGCTSLTACNGYVTGGFLYAQNPAPAITNPVSPANQAVYQTEWTGGQTNGVPVGGVAFTFGVPVPNGNYQVRLHFAELNKTGAGQRVFDVNIEGGANELTGFDVWTQAAGINRAIVREFTTTVVDGNLTIQFIRQVENAKISGIEILTATDTTPPLAPVITAPANNSFDTDGVFTVSGTAEAGSTVNLLEGALNRGTATTTAGGAWSIPLTGVADGAHTYTATATDAATNVSPASVGRTITVDTVRPLVSSTVPTSGASAIAVGANVTATFSEAMAAASLTATSFSLAPTAGGPAVAASPPSYNAATRVVTLDPTAALVAGVSYTATITTAASDLAGNTLLTAHTWTFTTATATDTTPPLAPVITAPANNSFDTDGVFTVSGTAEAGSTVNLLEGALNRGTATTTAGGAWSIPLTGVADGAHTYTATATDAATNVSPASVGRTITVDTVRPLVSSTVPTSGASAIAVGANVTATFSEAMAAASLTATSFSLAPTAGGPAVAASPPSYNAATRVVTLDPTAALVAGVSYTATITTAASDLAGNTLLTAHTWTFTTATATDTTPPLAPVITAPANNSFDTDGVFTVSGTAEAGSTVNLLEGALNRGTATTTAGGAWSIPLTGVADGAHTYTATATDAATNVSPASVGRTITVDTVRPLVSSTVPTSGASAIAVGANVTATFSEAMAAASLTATSFSLAPTAGGPAVAASPPSYNAATRVVTLDPTAALVAGVSYTATITTAASDLAGNTLLTAHTWTFTTATQANTATFLSAADTYTRGVTATKNYGLETAFRIRTPNGGNNQIQNGYVRFDVSGLAGRTVTGVTLRLFSIDAGPNGGAVYRTAAPWSETSVTYNAAPAVIGSKLADVGSVSANAWRDVQLPATVIAQDGPIGFQLSPATSKLLGFASRESANAPQLILTFAASGLTGAGLNMAGATSEPTIGVMLAPAASTPTAGPVPSSTPAPSASPTPTPSSTPTPSPTPTSSPTPTLTTGPSPTPSPSPNRVPPERVRLRDLAADYLGRILLEG